MLIEEIQKNISALIVEEKRARQKEEVDKLSSILCNIVELSFQSNSHEVIISNLHALAKKRGQLKRAVVEMVRKAYSLTLALPNGQLRHDCLKSLLEETEGKIYLEIENARVNYQLALYMEKVKKDISGAWDLVKDKQIETFSTLENREKLAFILIQLKYAFLLKEYTRFSVIRKKVGRKLLEDKELTDIKYYYLHMNYEYCKIQGLHQETADAAFDIYELFKNNQDICNNDARKTLQNEISVQIVTDQTLWFSKSIIYFILSPFDNYVSDKLNKFHTFSKEELNKTPKVSLLLNNFLFEEVTPLSDSDATTVSGMLGDTSCADLLKLRYYEKNVRVIAKYYKNVHFGKIGSLLKLEENKVESIVTDMIEDGRLDAKIDRPKRLVKIGGVKKYNDGLNQWGKGVYSLINSVEECVDQLEREGFVITN